jgi:hypothetical protein
MCIVQLGKLHLFFGFLDLSTAADLCAVALVNSSSTADSTLLMMYILDVLVFDPRC